MPLHDPIAALWSAVLVQAICDYLEPEAPWSPVEHVRLERAARIKSSAERWLFGSSDAWNGCESVCSYLGLDAQAVRAAVLAMRLRGARPPYK